MPKKKSEIAEDYGVYSEPGREEAVDSDALTDVDEGFMKGYEEGERVSKCPVCHVVIGQDFIEREIDNHLYRFCSDKHVEVFLSKRKKRFERIVGLMKKFINRGKKK